MARRAEKRNVWRGVGYFVLAALTLVVAGFLVHRDLGPRLWSRLVHRSAVDGAGVQSAPAPAQSVAHDGTGTPEDALSASERQALSEIIRKRAK